MNASDELEPRKLKEGEATNNYVALGAVNGDNKKLEAVLNKLADTINRDAPSGEKARSFLRLIGDCLYFPLGKVLAGLHWAVERFMFYEAENAKRHAEAHKLEAEARRTIVDAETAAMVALIKADAEVEKTKADTEIARIKAEAEAAKTMAEADAIQAAIKHRAVVLAKLKAKGIDFQAEVGEDGVMKLAVTKEKPEPPGAKE